MVPVWGASGGSSGIGDPYFPEAGNPGYRVTHYTVAVHYAPGSDRLTGTASLRLRPKQRLTSLNLDLLLRATSVTVAGVKASFRQSRHELKIHPRRPIREDEATSVTVHYRGKPARIRYDGERPFKLTRTGAVVVGEPDAAAWWFPSNDHPSDKATYSLRLTVPTGMEAVSNGILEGRTTSHGSTTWRWHVTRPMASYLAFAAFGQYDLQQGETTSGVPYAYAWEHGLGAVSKAAHASVRYTPKALRFLTSAWGRYPFDTVGGVVPAESLRFALENQTRPVYGRDMFRFGIARSLVVHEIAHQWFGDRLSLRRWKDIWLNEGFATYSEWLWGAAHGDRSPQKRLMRFYRLFEASNPFWDLRIGDPGPRRLFDEAVYDRGAMTVQALRNRVGTKDFFTLTRRWTHSGDGVTSTRELRRLATRVSGEHLGGFFRHWLYSGRKPAPTAANGL
jgi:aminopeptidase N